MRVYSRIKLIVIETADRRLVTEKDSEKEIVTRMLKDGYRSIAVYDVTSDVIDGSLYEIEDMVTDFRE